MFVPATLQHQSNGKNAAHFEWNNELFCNQYVANSNSFVSLWVAEKPKFDAAIGFSFFLENSKKMLFYLESSQIIKQIFGVLLSAKKWGGGEMLTPNICGF